MKTYAIAAVTALCLALGGCFPFMGNGNQTDIGSAVLGGVLSGVSQFGTQVVNASPGLGVVQPSPVVTGDPAVPQAPPNWVSKVVGWTKFGCNVLPVGSWVDRVFFHNQLAQPEQVANDLCDYVKNAPPPRARARLARNAPRRLGPAVIAGVPVNDVVVQPAK